MAGSPEHRWPSSGSWKTTQKKSPRWTRRYNTPFPCQFITANSQRVHFNMYLKAVRKHQITHSRKFSRTERAGGVEQATQMLMCTGRGLHMYSLPARIGVLKSSPRSVGNAQRFFSPAAMRGMGIFLLGTTRFMHHTTS